MPSQERRDKIRLKALKQEVVDARVAERRLKSAVESEQAKLSELEAQSGVAANVLSEQRAALTAAESAAAAGKERHEAARASLEAAQQQATQAETEGEPEKPERFQPRAPRLGRKG
ncbi:MAG: hypothetical protein HY329_26025 [Chloroflexi bacterium]|nr:hypothetical protein [Chloroflexota bacterium]